MRRAETANDIAWARVFAQIDILATVQAHGFVVVSADDLKRFGGREPRLMAKLDTISSLPEVFRNNALTIFPTRNGEYAIFSDPEFKTYFTLAESSYPTTIEMYQPRVDLRTFDAFPGLQRLNESQALDFALVSSLLRHVTNDSGLNLVIRGRTYSGRFDFALPNSSKRVQVEGVQIEVDGGYESGDVIVLVEAKIGRRVDFNMRQLYYPYLEWSARSSKRIVPLFLVVTNGLFYFFEIKFGSKFGELSIAQARGFSFDESPVTRIELATAFSRVPIESEPLDIPFPQANDLDKVVDLISMLETGSADKRAIAEYFEFDTRQSDYYGNAAAYLGFAHRRGSGFEITALGRRFIAEERRAARTIRLFEQLLRRPIWRDILRLLFNRSMQIDSISSDDVVSAIRARTGKPLSENTIVRRSQTVLSWLRWIDQNVTLVE
jgi:hypothetical protein